MNNIMTFVNEEFGSIRSTVINCEPWLVGKDVAQILGYTAPRSAVSKKVDKEDRGVAKMVLLTNPHFSFTKHDIKVLRTVKHRINQSRKLPLEKLYHSF